MKEPAGKSGKKHRRNRSPRVTSFDVAALAGVSQSAVSRAFTPGSSISEETRVKVFEAARKLKYVRNSIASSLTTSRSNIVALILGDLTNPFYVHVLYEFSQQLQKQGQQVLTFIVGPGMDADDAILNVLQYQVDGLILTSAQISTRMTSMCFDRGIPIVLFNRYIPNSETSCVRCDNVEGGAMMADTMLAAGACTFAMITGDPRGTTSQDRVKGFTDRLINAGIRASDIVSYHGNSSYEGAAAATRQMWEDRGGAMPDAVFGINDIMAMGAMDELRSSLGLRIPEDVMVAGFDDIPEGGRVAYRLTTVRQPIGQMVAETLRILSMEREDAEHPGKIDARVPPRMIWRDTVPEPDKSAGKDAILVGRSRR